MGVEHRHLAAVLNHFEGGAHGELGLAIPHVAAEQPVHGLGAFQIALDVGDGGELVRRLLKCKRVFELALPGCVGGGGNPAAHFAVGVELQKLLRHVAQGALDSGLGAFPGGAAQAVQGRFGAFVGAILFHQVQALQGHVEPGLILKSQQHEVARRARHGNLPQTLINADAVIDVHHVVADLQVPEVGDKA